MCGTAVANGVGLGTGRPGGYAERVVVDAQMLFALPDAVDDRAGTLVEPTAVAVHALTRARPLPGERLAVVGAGPIGILTALVAREQGLEVVLVSRNPGRAQSAEALGLRTVTPEGASAGDPVAIAMECACTGSAAALALELVPPLGRVVMVGKAPAPFTLDPLPMIFKRSTSAGAIIYRRTDFDTAIELLAGGTDPERRADRRARAVRSCRGDVSVAAGPREPADQGAARPGTRRLTGQRYMLSPGMERCKRARGYDSPPMRAPRTR